MRYYLIAGEASGDLHGSNLIKGLLSEDPQSRFRFFGGEKMLQASAGRGELVRHYKDGAVMGLGDVLGKAGYLLRKLSDCKADILAYNPDVVILVDYPGFNMKIARFCHKRGIRVFYYIAPKTWASRAGRNRQLKKYVDKLYIIFPFECNYFEAHKIPYVYLGNPLLDAIRNCPAIGESQEEFRGRCGLDGRDYVAILAGSRSGEIRRMMPVCTELVERLSRREDCADLQYVIAAAPSVDVEVYRKLVPPGLADRVKVVQGETYPVLSHARAAIVNSGTASLETAIIGTPQVVCWSTGAFTAWIARHVLHVMDHIKYVSLGNLCIDKLAFRELIQEDFNVDELEKEVLRLLFDEEYRDSMICDYGDICTVLGGDGASNKIAKSMIQNIL